MPHVISAFVVSVYPHSRATLPFPTRRSSDLPSPARRRRSGRFGLKGSGLAPPLIPPYEGAPAHDLCVHDEGRGAHTGKRRRDRKSTRLNSSHVAISYAVFCSKKKTRKSNTSL